MSPRVVFKARRTRINRPSGVWVTHAVHCTITPRPVSARRRPQAQVGSKCTFSTRDDSFDSRARARPFRVAFVFYPAERSAFNDSLCSASRSGESYLLTTAPFAPVRKLATSTTRVPIVSTILMYVCRTHAKPTSNGQSPVSFSVTVTRLNARNNAREYTAD